MGARAIGAALFAWAIALLSLSAGTASATGWLPPVNVSGVNSPAASSDLSAQDVAVDGEGNAIAVWVQSGEAGWETVETATRPAGGHWSGGVELSDPGEEPLGLQVAVNPAGDAAVIWAGYGSGSGLVVRAAIRPAGGAWSEPVALSDPEDDADEPSIAIDAQGTVTAVWTAGELNDYGVVEAATRPAGGDWGEAVELSDGLASTPLVAVDPEGEVTAVWTLVDLNRYDGVIQSKTRSAAGEWSAEAVDVSGEGALASEPTIAVDPQGDATVVWRRQDIPGPNGIHTFVQTAQRVDGAWSAPFSLSNEDGIAGDADVTVDPQGNATAIWFYWGTSRFVQVRSRTAAGAWGETVTLSAKSGMLEPQEGNLQVAADAGGNVTALWETWAAPNLTIRSARLEVGGAWSAPVTLSAAGSYSLWPQMAVDPQGHVTALWSGRQGTTQAVRSRVLDPVAPELRELTVPASGTVGKPVAMAVDPFDLFSPVATSWNFGDGGTGAGATVQHCFSSPGTRTVTVTGTDLAANVASATRTITIAPDPSPALGIAPCGGPVPLDPPRPPSLQPPSHNPAPPPAAAPTCVVPKLAGKTLKAAKKLIRAANCKVGLVRRPKPLQGKGRQVLVVKSSNPRAGASPASGKVHLKLRPRPL
jgi:hypothetical protein